MPYLPLTGVRILDLTRLLPGPYCTLLLADLGAEVIKIETPLAGDYARLAPPHLGLSSIFQATNRNKKSVAVNYRNPRGREILQQLAAASDVVFESFRPGVVKRFGMDYDSVRALNPRVIYCSLSGYGQSGPYRDRAGHDLNYSAVGGLLALNGPAGGPPTPYGVEVADLSAGMLAATAILAALYGRERTGQGAYLDVSLLDAVVSWVSPFLDMRYLGAGRNPERGRQPLSGGAPCFNVYETSDGKYLTLGALEPNFWSAFCALVERPDLIPRQFESEAIPEVAAIFRARPRGEWLARLGGADTCVEPVNTFDELWQHPQVRHRGLIVSGAEGREHIGSPFQFVKPERTAPAPALGAHTREVLRKLGISDDEIQALETQGIVKSA
jgi:crotonobetainyl-CoA:carnitine CoA-transferase CaiB-like acyl-CoA transferase